ncbi:hypothetical protein AN219_04605 [Streptomyces nanshensis]|nr:hypothetical protein AN219_04605 [Streptomyces nanshensis]
MTVNLTKPAGGGSVPPLSKYERKLLGAVALGGVGVGGLGLVSSFNSVSDAAERWGFSEPWMLPVGIDIAIPVFTVVNLLLIRMNMRLAWVRFVPWVLTLVTCALNVAAGKGLSAKLAHGTMPLLWVVLSEVAAHVYAVRIGIATGARMERIRRSRWLLAPLDTFALWRRMVLWETTRYTDALEREQTRQLARADLREQYGRGWRRKAPRRTRVLLKFGELVPKDAVQASGGQDKPAPDPEPEQAPEPSRASRQRRASKGKANKAPRLTFEEQLAKARKATASWTEQELKAEPIRQALGCGQERSRQLRDALKNERRQAPPSGPVGVAA